MKKFFLTIFTVILCCNVGFCEDLWDNFGDTNVYGQQSVTDDEFEKALESKQKKKSKKNKNVPKGENFSQSNETQAIIDKSKEPLILLIPVALKFKDAEIPIGHYEVEGVKEDGNIYFKLYQAHRLIAKIPAQETNDDFGEPTINFVKLLPHGNYHVQIIFGGMDFNAYSIIDME